MRYKANTMQTLPPWLAPLHAGDIKRYLGIKKVLQVFKSIMFQLLRAQPVVQFQKRNCCFDRGYVLSFA